MRTLEMIVEAEVGETALIRNLVGTSRKGP